MATRRRIKKTKAFALDAADEQYIKDIAEQRDTNSDSEALRQIISDHRLFSSPLLASVKEFQQSKPATTGTDA